MSFFGGIGGGSYLGGLYGSYGAVQPTRRLSEPRRPSQDSVDKRPQPTHDELLANDPELDNKALERMLDIVKASDWAMEVCSDADVWRELLALAYRSRNYSEKDAMMVCRNYGRFRSAAQWPMKLSRKDIPDSVLMSGVHWLLPGTDKEGRTVVVLNVGKLVIDATNTMELYQMMGAYIVEQAARLPSTQENGICLVVDLEGLTWELMWQLFSIDDIARGTGMWRDTFPSKLRRVFVLRASTISDYLIETVLSFAAPKVQARCIVCIGDDMHRFHEEVPPAMLPPSLGGTVKDFDWAKYVDEHFTK